MPPGRPDRPARHAAWRIAGEMAFRRQLWPWTYRAVGAATTLALKLRATETVMSDAITLVLYAIGGMAAATALHFCSVWIITVRKQRDEAWDYIDARLAPCVQLEVDDAPSFGYALTFDVLSGRSDPDPRVITISLQQVRARILEPGRVAFLRFYFDVTVDGQAANKCVSAKKVGRVGSETPDLEYRLTYEEPLSFPVVGRYHHGLNPSRSESVKRALEGDAVRLVVEDRSRPAVPAVPAPMPGVVSF